MQHLLVILMAFCFLCGCSQKNDAFLVKVDGVALTQHDVERQTNLRLKLMQHGGKRPLKQEQVTYFKNSMAKDAVSHFVRQAMLKKVAREKGIEFSRQALAAHYDHVASCMGYANYAAMKANLDKGEQKLFESTSMGDLLSERGEAILKERIDVTVSDKEVDEAFVKLEQINADAAATNRLVFATATNVYNRIVRGELKFDEAVAQYSQEPGKLSSGLWGSLSTDDLQKHEPQLLSLLQKGKFGKIFPPMEGDNACVICRQGDYVEKTKSYVVFRVVFNLAQIWNKPTPEDMRKVLSSNKLNAGLEKAMEELQGKSVIAYPPEAYTNK